MDFKVPALTGLDKDLALSRVGGDEDLLRDIALLFLDDYPQVLGELKTALTAGDAHKAERTAHTLKGSVANFGAQAAVAAALEIEKLGRGGLVAEARAVLPRLEAALDALRPELEAL